jgi:adenine-specific DNA-methyltransferase
MNYTGGKYKLLPQILPLFPEDINAFVDLFCGGCDVGINTSGKRVVFNDSNEKLIGLLKTLRDNPKSDTFHILFGLIEKYGLSRSDLQGYDYYSCDSADGLALFNKERFIKLRNDFNGLIKRNKDYYLMLYLLIVFAFNNQIRFNHKGEYNLPVGKRDFNRKMQGKLESFIDRVQSMECEFSCLDYGDVDIDDLDRDSFVYADPPYLITCASYNEQNGWTNESEKNLLTFLDSVHNKGIRFALSNVIECKGNENEILKEWLIKNDSIYKVIELSMDYSNSNYHKKNRDSISREILIVNY